MGAIKLSQFEEFPEFSIKAMTIWPDLIQTRDKVVDPRWSKRYADLKAKGSPFPSVTLFRDIDKATGKELFILGDGHTRVDAAKRLGLKTIPAVVRIGGIQEAMLFGIQANLDPDNFREITTKDRARAVEMMIRNGAGVINAGTWDWSDGGIALQCGCSAIFVLRTRLRLSIDENIPIPTKVQKIKDGKPTGKWVAYSQKKDGRNSMHVDRRGRAQTKFDGKTLTFPRGTPSPEKIIEDLLTEREKNKTYLVGSDTFRNWAIRRRIPILPIPKSSFCLGGSSVGTAVVFPLQSEDLDIFCSTAFHALCAKESELQFNRAIVVGYVIGNRWITQLLPFLAQLGIEVMTPEEFIEKFGPQSIKATIIPDWNIIRRVCVARNLMQQEVAIGLGVSENMISEFATGRRRPNSEFIAALAQFLGMTPEEFVAEFGPKDATAEEEGQP